MFDRYYHCLDLLGIALVYLGDRTLGKCKPRDVAVVLRGDARTGLIRRPIVNSVE